MGAASPSFQARSGAGFSGFPEEGLRFLKSLKRNNRREWFQPRKEIYEASLKAPMLELVSAINNDLVKIAPDYVTDPKKATFRIYRDTRFSHDKTPYKTHIAAVFGKRGMAGHSGGMLYFHLSPEGVEAAGGVYHPEPDALRRVRLHVSENHAELTRILGGRKLRSMMGDLKGDELSRVPRGFPTDHPSADLIRKKDWILDVTIDVEAAKTAALIKELTSRFRLMLPFVEFFNRALRPVTVYRQSDRL